MSNSALFSLSGIVAMSGWVILFFTPRWKNAIRVVRIILVLILCLLYVWLLAKGIQDFSFDSFSSLERIRVLFQNDDALLAGWIHYLAFDLFVGSWIMEDSLKKNVSLLIVFLILPAVFLFGPLGYLIYHLYLFLSLKKHSSNG